jgi:hypothetical protein
MGTKRPDDVLAPDRRALRVPSAMPGLPIHVERLSSGQLNASIAVATRAFSNDPMFNFFAPDLLVQHKNLVGFFAAGIHDCAEHGEVWVATSETTLAGVAAWLPPASFPPQGARGPCDKASVSLPPSSGRLGDGPRTG